MAKKTEDSIDYDQIITQAMRKTLQLIFKKVEKNGLPGDHHFVITFSTMHKDVILSPLVKQKYPIEMTVVLQHQFRNLVAEKNYLQVELSFNRKMETVRIPYNAITYFADPSVNFELSFSKNITLLDDEFYEEESPSETSKSDSEKNMDNKNNLVYFDSLEKNKK